MTAPFWRNTDSAEQIIADLGDGSLWDVCTLGGHTLPGLASVKGASSKRGWDIQSPPSYDGAVYRDQGYTPSKFEVQLLLWTEQQWTALQAILPSISPKPGKRRGSPEAFPVTHPALELLGIDKLIVEEVTSAEPGSIPSSKSVTFKCAQWIKSRRIPIGTPQFNMMVAAGIEEPPTPSGTNSGPGPWR